MLRLTDIQLKTRIAILSALGIVAMVGSLLFYSAQNTQHQTSQAANARAKLLAETSANAISIPMWDFNEEQVRNVINNLGRDTDFEYARVADDDGRIIAQSGVHNKNIDNITQVVAPIHYAQGGESKRIGTLTLQLNTNQYKVMLRDHLIVTSIVYALVALGISILIYRLLSHALRPLENLSKVMAEYSQGNRSATVDTSHAAPEIRTLIDTFTGMRLKVDNYQEHLEHEVEERTKELSEAMEVAQSANKAKSVFLATIGHEIRTPLNGIIGMADLLTRRDLGKKENEFSKIIFRSGKTLLLMINNILDFSKAEAGKITMSMEPVKLRERVEDSVALMKQLAEEKGLSLEPRIEHDASVLGDAQYIKQTLLNLINNAIKFTKDGGVIVTMKRQGDVAMISVRDTGIGITEENRKRLFQAFTQIEDGSDRRYEGTGLGLVICKRFIEQMGGAIGVESEAGKGSCFWFTLPLI